MNEDACIRLFAALHGTKPYLADAEIVKRESAFLLFTMDGFSEEEDFFLHTPPEIIGRNMACAVCADLLACGVTPEIWLQNWNIDETKGMDYYRGIGGGIERVLQFYGAECVGGDTGCSVPWSYAAVAYAQTERTPVTRCAARRIPFELYASGRMGCANLAAFRSGAMPELSMHDPVPGESLFATDTSGGFFDALENFRRVNTGMRLRVDLEQALSPEVLHACPSAIDPCFTLIGGVGEYELLYAVPCGTVCPGIRIGEGDFRECRENDFRLFRGNRPFGRMRSAPPDYRNIPETDRLRATEHYFRELAER